MVYLFLIGVALALPLAAAPFDFAQVREQARTLAQQPFRHLTNQIPENLARLDYNGYQAIHFNRQQGLWAGEGLPFQIEFFLPGSLHKDAVLINEVTSQGVRPLPFQPGAFSFGTNQVDLPANLAYAGLRIVQPPHQFQEVGSFLGASYFRMAGIGGEFGASARGLGINTSQLGHEEFPAFKEFWLRKPGAQDRSLTLWGLIDSPSATGAMEMTITPGADTVCSVEVAFFVRKAVQALEVAPLTSMFDYDQNSHLPDSDFRPEVHDSDGLLMETGQGQWIWRPLDAGKAARVNAYQDVNPKGFGLMQRQRNYELYQDPNARYERRPSVWVKTHGRWGGGHVELLQLPTNVEYNDNVVAYWVPAQQLQPGQSLQAAYEIHWLTNEVSSSALGHVRATRIGQVPGQPQQLRFVVDFDGRALAKLSPAPPLVAEVQAGEGTRVLTKNVTWNEVNGTWRLLLEVARPSKPVDLHARLLRESAPVTETWAYTWQP